MSSQRHRQTLFAATASLTGAAFACAAGCGGPVSSVLGGANGTLGSVATAAAGLASGSGPLEAYRHRWPTPAPSASPTVAPSPAPSPTPSPYPTASPTPYPTPSSGTSPTPAPSPTPSSAPTPTPTGALYVSTAGSDSNAGTSSSAPLRNISTAAKLAQPGTTIYIAGGTYYEQVVTSVSGQAGAPITFTSYNGTAIIDGSNLSWTVGSNQNQGLFQLQNPYVTLSGLKITNSKNSGIVLNADNLTISGCEVSYAQRHGISTNTSRQTAVGGTMIRNIVLSGNTIDNDTVMGNGYGQPVSLIADGFRVTGNTAFSNYEIPIDIWLGATHGEVDHNSIYNNSNQTAIYTDGVSYVRIHDNTIHDNLDGITIAAENTNYQTKDVWVYDNIAYNLGNIAFSIWGPSGTKGMDNSWIFNNSFYGVKLGVYLNGVSVCYGDEIFNNTGSATNGGLYKDSGDTSTYTISNNVWSASGFVAPPANLQLTSGAPQIGAGMAIPTMVDDLGNTYQVTTDAAGNPRVVNGRTDAGAYEY